LNECQTSLDVPKRRIYDITNVLEGIGLVEKKSKNIIQWKGNTVQTQNEKDKIQLYQKKCDDLKDQDKKLLEQLEFVRSSLRKLTDLNNPQPFITHQDILTIPSLRSDTLIAIRAPPGTKLEVPDPDEGNDGKRRFQIYLRNDQNEVIDVFLVQAGEKEEKIHSPFNSPKKKWIN